MRKYLRAICLAVVGLAAFRAVPVRKAAGTLALAGAAYACALGLQAGCAHLVCVNVVGGAVFTIHIAIAVVDAELERAEEAVVRELVCDIERCAELVVIVETVDHIDIVRAIARRVG